MTLAADPKPGILTPVFESDGLEVLACMLDVEHERIHEMGACLTVDECRRAESLRWERDRRRFVLTRGQLRHCLGSRLGIPPTEVELEYGCHGKPHLSRRMPVRDLHFGVSRSGDMGVIALSKTREVGVDIEEIRLVPEADDIAELCFSASEHQSYRVLPPEEKPEGFLRRWTRLEAVSKALGCGLGEPVPTDDRDWDLHTFVPKVGYIGSLVVQN